jgi:hypothetical protein
MDVWNIVDTVDLDKPEITEYPIIWGTMGDHAAHSWAVKLTKSGAPASLTGGTAAIRFIRADGVSVIVEGTISGNVASVVFPQEAYAVEGPVRCLFRFTFSNGVLTTVRRNMRITRESSEPTVVPGVSFAMTEEVLNMLGSGFTGGAVRITRTLITPGTGYNFTNGDDAGPLTGKGGVLRILVPAGSTAPTGTSSPILLQVNGIQTGYRTTIDASENADHIGVGYIRNAFGLIEIRLNVVGGAGLMVSGMYAFSDGTTRTNGVFTGALLSGVSAISALNVYTMSGYTFPTGTIIEYREAA